MTYSAQQLKVMDAKSIARCSPVHMESVIAELIETAKSAADDVRRYEYLLTCDYISARKYLPSLDEAEWKAKLRYRHDNAITPFAGDPFAGIAADFASDAMLTEREASQ